MTTLRFFVVLAVADAVGVSYSPAALAADPAFGTPISDCAHVSLGQRAGDPAVTCTHDGLTMTFDTFGQMVEHMLDGR